MNNSTEQAMKAWRPRQPSAGLRRRIFVSEPPELAFARAPFDWAGLMRWLVPAMGCFVMMTGMALHPSTQIPPGALGPLGGQQLAFSLAEGHSGWNSVPTKNLEWTFGRPSSSSSDSFVGSDTNTLHK